jgi:hypothetical protein
MVLADDAEARSRSPRLRDGAGGARSRWRGFDIPIGSTARVKPGRRAK